MKNAAKIKPTNKIHEAPYKTGCKSDLVFCDFWAMRKQWSYLCNYKNFYIKLKVFAFNLFFSKIKKKLFSLRIH